MANTIPNTIKREKYAKSRLDHALDKFLVSKSIFAVDTSNNQYVRNPFIAVDGVTDTGTMGGTYTVGEFDITDDVMEVTKFIPASAHIFDFEERFNDFTIDTAVIDRLAQAVATKMDSWCLNEIADQATANIATPSGGFTETNIDDIFGEISTKFMGFSETFNGVYVVIENTDAQGLVQKQVNTGFRYADESANNGLIGRYMGVDIHVVRTGTFATATILGDAYTNASVRLAGVRNTASVSNIKAGYEEKSVSGKTGKELVLYSYAGAKVWTTMTDLTATVTLTA